MVALVLGYAIWHAHPPCTTLTLTIRDGKSLCAFFFLGGGRTRQSRRLRENIMMKIYDDNDMDAPGMELAKAGLDALVDDLKTAELSKVRYVRITQRTILGGVLPHLFLHSTRWEPPKLGPVELCLFFCLLFSTGGLSRVPELTWHPDA